MNTPEHLKYAASHEWSSLDDGIATVGITDYAQDQLGDVVFVELPEIGSRVNAGAGVAVVESVKTASDIYTPLSGRVVAINESLLDEPEKINQSPYGDGWIFRLEPDDPAEFGKLLDAASYAARVEES